MGIVIRDIVRIDVPEEIRESLFPEAYVIVDAPYADFLEYGTQPSRKQPSRPSGQRPKGLSTTSTKIDPERWKDVPEPVRKIAEWLRSKNYSSYRQSDDYVSAKGKGGAAKSMRAGMSKGYLNSEKDLYDSAQAIFASLMKNGMAPHPFFRKSVHYVLAHLGEEGFIASTPLEIADLIADKVRDEMSRPDSQMSLWGSGNMADSVKTGLYRDSIGGFSGSMNVPPELWESENAKRGLGKWNNANYGKNGKIDSGGN